MVRLIPLALLLLAIGGNVIPPFTPGEGDIPQGWEELTFPKISRHTDYRMIDHDGKVAVKAFADSAASALVFSTDVSPEATLSWSWNVLAPVDGANVAFKGQDDAAARVYVLFGYDPDKADLWTALTFNATKLIYGDYPPLATITYIWSNRLPQGEFRESPYTPRSRMIALRKGTPTGGWVSESVRPGDDYRTIFHDEPPRITGIGIMTDSDNTGGVATAWYADFSLIPEQGTTP